MTFWPLTNSEFPTDQTFHQFHDLYTELVLHRIMSGFHGAFATGVASQQGTLTLPDTWFRPPFWDLLMLQLLRPGSSSLPCLYSTFHLEYPLVLSRFCYLEHVSSFIFNSLNWFCNLANIRYFCEYSMIAHAALVMKYTFAPRFASIQWILDSGIFRKFLGNSG